MSWWKKFREFDNRGLLIDHVEGHMAYTKTGYVFNRWFFRAYVLLLVLVIVAAIGTASELSGHYVHCPEGAGSCPNPLFMNCAYDWCRDFEMLEFLPAGFTRGSPPGDEYYVRFRVVTGFAVLGAIIVLFLNHFRYNRGKVPFDLEVSE